MRIIKVKEHFFSYDESNEEVGIGWSEMGIFGEGITFENITTKQALKISKWFADLSKKLEKK